MMKKIFKERFWTIEKQSDQTPQPDAIAEPSPANFRLSRGGILAISLVFVALLAVASWLVGSQIQSPAEAAARTAPPTPSPILVPVEERILTSDVITRGTARFGLPQSISLAPSPLKGTAGIITTLPARGDQIDEGQVLLTASGRPVFLLQGDIPAYRDLVFGLSGKDVLQLESALHRLNFDPGQVDGIYDEKTSAAVTDWYSSAGFEPFGPTGEQLVNIHTLENEMTLALNEKSTAEDALAIASLAVEAAQAQAEYDVATSSGSAQALARLNGELAVKTAENEEKTSQRELERLTSRVDQVRADLEAARLAASAPVLVDEIVFLPSIPVRIEEINTKIGGEASGPLLGVTNDQLAIDSSLPLEEASLVKPGMSVAIDEPDLGIQANGVVSRVADTPGTDGVDGYHVYFEVLVEETPTSLEGISLRLTIPVDSTGGAVTVVPISALSLAADGTSRVQVETDGNLEFLVVEPGLSADGFVAVKPVDGSLKAGQLVLVGYEKNQ
ncbi:MAG: peptidoglycan-binding protein [Anaerolineales bacterium]